jgi:ABC-2 type transport system ATP-binding protein
MFLPREPVLALDKISFGVAQGELLVLVGPNGAGKTTLIKILSGLILPTEGSVSVCGCDVVRDENKVKSIIGLVTGGERSFYWRISGRKNLEFFAALYNLRGAAAKKRVDYLVDLLGINNPGRRFQEYPAGVMQRFAIARSLLHDPKVIIMDEPTRNLDPLSAEDLRLFIREELVKKMGKTVLFCTHNLTEAASFGGRIAIMDKGRIIACDHPEELRKKSGLPKDSRLEEVFRHYVGV